MSEALARTTRRLRRKLVLAAWLGRSARWGAGVAALCACAALVARVSFALELREASLCFLPLALVPFVAARGLRGVVFDEHAAAAWMDLRSGAQGYLVAAEELDDPRWRARAAAQLEALPELPALNGGAFARPLVPALAFAALALLLPLERAEPGPSSSLFDRAIAGLAERLDLLQDVVALDPQKAEELSQRVAELAEDVDASEPEAMLEAIDALRESLGVEGQQAGELAQALSDRLGEVGAAALADPERAQDMLRVALDALDKSGLRGDLMSQLDELAPQLAAAVQGNRLQLPEGLQLSPEQMQRLSEGLRDALQKNLGDLSLAGLVNLAALAKAGEAGDLERLLAKLHQCDERCKQPGGT
ncbi:MAG: hypothetical protein H6828_06210 [Planctomycetes bacterium]|nr:hypothetical protein [Planctomycetota bacterium]